MSRYGASDPLMRLIGEGRMELVDEMFDMIAPYLGESPERWLGAGEMAGLILTLISGVPEHMRENMGLTTDGEVVNPMVLVITTVAARIFGSPEHTAALAWKEAQ